MPLAYNTTWLHSLAIAREAKRWLESKLISAEQYQALKAAHTTPLYTPNIFVRIGLAIFTAICVGAAVGLFGMMFNAGGDSGISIWFLMTGAGCIVALEFLIREKKLYCAGIDDALLYMSLGLLFAGIVILLFRASSDISPTIPAIIMLPILIAATIRYADRLTSLAAYATLLWLISYPMLRGGPLAQALLPFVLMVVSIVAYFTSTRIAQRDEFSHWKNPLTIIEIASLVTFYLAGNYFIVRESTVNLLFMEIPEGGNIPFALVFYFFTICVPLAYVVVGLMKRDNILIRVGLLAAAFSAFTFRYYFSLGHPEVVLTLAGVLLIGVAALAIRYLKSAKNGFTHERLIAKKFENLDTEMLVVSQTLGATPQQQPSPEFKGGGGEFGGGGTTEKW